MPHGMSRARWREFVMEHHLSAEEQVRLREMGLEAEIERGEANGELAALKELVRLRPPEPRRAEGRPGPMGVGGGPRVRRGTRDELEHARVISERIALFADLDPGVQGFRRSLFGSPKSLSARRARALLASPLLRFATKGDLDQWGVPLLEHQSAITSQADDGREVSVQVKATWPDNERAFTFGWKQAGLPDRYVEFPDRGRRRAVGPVWLASVLDELQREANRLARGAPYCALQLARVGAEPACVWLVLTGQPPTLEPITATMEIPGSVDSITITALTRVVSPETVMRTFAEMQRRTLGHRKGRRFQARNLELVLFVERSEKGPVKELASDRANVLCRSWNEKHATEEGWEFADGRDLSRAYKRAKESFFPDNDELWLAAALHVLETEMKRRSSV